jgi:N-acetyl-beta-hexosaminidase
MEDIRIDAAAEIVEDFDADTIVQQSADATFVFLPLQIKQNRILDPTGKSFERSLPRLPVSAVVMAAEDIDLDAAPEEGLAAQIARATDDLEAARKKAVVAEKAAAEKQTALENLNSRLNALENKGVSGVVPLDTREELKTEIKDAESGAEKAHRRAIKAKVKADDVAKTIDALNPGSTSEKEPSKKT